MADMPAASKDDLAAELADLRLQVAQLQRDVRARDDFIAIAAHELRNPMTPILGVAQLALLAARKPGAQCPPRVMALLERLQLVVQDFIERATRLLDVGRVEAGNLVLQPEPVDLSALFISIARKYEDIALRAESPITLDIEPAVSGLFDRLALEQIAENLVTNALKFGSGEPITIQLRRQGETVWFAVQDRGIGMNEDQQERIFGRFEQVVTQYAGSGFGIGLWVASRLVTAMQGRISVTSQPGQGAVFSVTLPLQTDGTTA